jgi:hypothetical protein
MVQALSEWRSCQCRYSDALLPIVEDLGSLMTSLLIIGRKYKGIQAYRLPVPVRPSSISQKD